MIDCSITVKDFNKIGSTNQYWLWHFLPNFENSLELRSVNEKPVPNLAFNSLRYVIENTKIPYFESFSFDSLDFLINLAPEFTPKSLISPRDGNIIPVVLAFNYRRFVTSTLTSCYCINSVLDLIGQLNPEYLLKLD